MRVPVPSEVLARVHDEVARHGRVALCQVLRAEGSTPGKPGWRLLVAPDGSTFGNLGGGAFEALVRRDATARLGTGSPTLETKRYYLTEEAVQGEATGMACGGMMEVCVELVEARPRLLVFGGGPVGQALARHAAPCDFDVVVADDRADFRRPQLFPEGVTIAEVGADLDPDELASAPWASLYVAVVSRCWETDAAALAAVLRRAPRGLEYLGLMGSRRKIEKVRSALEAKGLDLERAPFRAPIGLELGGSTPDEIAVAIVAELIRERAAARAAREPDGAERGEVVR